MMYSATRVGSADAICLVNGTAVMLLQLRLLLHAAAAAAAAAVAAAGRTSLSCSG